MPDDPTVPLTRRLGRRLMPWHWTLLDVVIACVVTAEAAVQVATRHQEPNGVAWDLVRYLAAGAACLPLPWRRRHPAAVLAVITTGVSVSLAVHTGSWLMQVATVAMYSTAALTPPRRSLGWLIGCVLAVLAGALVGSSGNVSDALATGPLLLAIGWLVGENVRGHRAYARATADRAAEREAEREQRIRRAAVEERIRIARELHDALAHAMSVITVRSGVARMLIDRQPDEARNALRIIETTSRDVMREMRLLLGVLRASHTEALVPVAAPGLDQLADLVARTEKAGVCVEATVRGPTRPLPTSVDRSAYRIVQEALTNVARHAGPASHARLHITYDPAHLAIEIINDGSPVSGTDKTADQADRHGLIGMRERVHLFGGEFLAGPLPGGGFRVLARIPAPQDTSGQPL